MLAYDEYNDYKQLEHDHFDGESFHFLTIFALDKEKDEITLVVQNLGKIKLSTYELFEELNGDIYFEYGPTNEKIYLNDFTIGD